MAEIISSSPGTKSNRRKNHPAKIDMTPMVDLAFLLLTFFVLAASLSKPKAMELIYPDKSPVTTVINKRSAITLLIGDKPDEVFYYEGLFDSEQTQLIRTSFSARGFRQYLFERNSHINERVDALKQEAEKKGMSDAQYSREYNEIVSDREAPFVVIKTLPTSKYDRVVSAVDELNITGVRKRCVQGMTDDEIKKMQEQSVGYRE